MFIQIICKKAQCKQNKTKLINYLINNKIIKWSLFHFDKKLFLVVNKFQYL